MTKKSAPAAAVAEEQPQQGGSYVRQPDGSLDRVEWTAHRDEPAVEPAPAAADPAPAAGSDGGE